MKTHTIFKECYTDVEWYNLLLQYESGLPNDYHDLFDEYGEVKEEYDEIFNVDIYQY